MRPQNPITPTQRRVLRFIQQHRRDKGYSPTLREIAAHFGWAGPAAANGHVQALAKKGAVTVACAVARGIVPVEG